MAPKVHTVSLTEIAEYFDVTTRSIQSWREHGFPTRMISGAPRFVVKDCIRWRREADKEEAAPVAKNLDKEDELAGKIKAERELKELELKERRGALVPAEVFQERVDSLFGGFAAVAAGQLQRFERDIVRATDAVSARHVTQAIQVALMKGAQEYADTLEAEAQATDEPEVAA